MCIRVMQQQMRSIEEARPPKHRFLQLTVLQPCQYQEPSITFLTLPASDENIGNFCPRRGKCGILGFVANFMEFAETTEKIFGDSDRKGDLEKW